MNEKDFLKKALSDEIVDKNAIYEQILLSANTTQDRSIKMRSIKRVLIAAACISLVGITAVASVRLLSAQQVAEELEFTDQSGETVDHFSKPFTLDSAVDVQQTQSDNGLNITFLGFAHGEGIDNADLNADPNKTYVVIAVENADGTAITQEFFEQGMMVVSPFIKGYNPGLHNAFTLGANGSGTLIDGVMYQLMEVDNIEYFANETLYLGVSDCIPNNNVFMLNGTSGEITANTNYEGLSVLFDLPIDTAKADDAKVQEYFSNYENQGNAEETEEPIDDMNYEELYQMYISEGLDEETAKNFAEIDILNRAIASLTIDELQIKGELSHEKTTTADTNGSFAIYWNETDKYTDFLSGEFALLEIGKPFVASIGSNETTSTVLVLEKISDTEIKYSVYKFNNSDFI